MSHLLDTHALLWALGDPARLGPRAREVISEPSEPLFVSSASAWEIATKQRLGKLPHSDAVVANYARNLSRLAITSVPVTDEHALLAGRLDWAHRDPFDRVLAAVAMTEGWVLITRDKVFATYPGLRTLW